MVLNFSLSPDATGRVYELLACLAKFGDTVSIEARAEKASTIEAAIYTRKCHSTRANRHQLTLTALNSSRTAYASFSLDANSFFLVYDFNVRKTQGRSDRFTCQLFNKVSS